MQKVTAVAEVLKDIAIAAYKADRKNKAQGGDAKSLAVLVTAELLGDGTLIPDISAAIPGLTGIPAELKAGGFSGAVTLFTEIEKLVEESIAEINALPPLTPPAPAV